MTDMAPAADGVPTFDSYDAPDEPTKPFRLSGRLLVPEPPTEPGGEPVERWSEDFQILGTSPQGALATLAGAVTIKDGVIHYTSHAVIRFLKAVIVPTDELRFDQLVNDKNRVLPLEQLGDVMLWAAGMVSGRPTGPLSSSAAGQRDDAPGSEADGSSPAGTPEPSTD